MSRLKLFLAALALWMAAAGAAAQSAIPQVATRAQALAFLEHAEAGHRASAVHWLGRFGLPADDALLHRHLTGDAHPSVRVLAERALWLLWSRSGDAEVDRLLARGVEDMEARRLEQAIEAFSQVVRRKPGFAEGWNKRATAYYLAGDFARSLADCDEVMKRNPRHFGALAGYGQIYVQLEQLDKALEYFRRALRVNPNMTGVEINIRELEELLKARKGTQT